MGKTLMIGSCEPFSGKSAFVLGIARQLMAANHKIRFGKPLATSLELEVKNEEFSAEKPLIDDDVRFVGETLGLIDTHLIPSIQLSASSTADDVAQLALKLGYEFSGDELLRFSGNKVGKVTVKKNDVPGEYN